MALILSATVDCPSPECEHAYVEQWACPREADTVEDLVEPPVVENSACPRCGTVQKDLEYPGWMFRSEAG
jgi:hypothetical protein